MFLKRLTWFWILLTGTALVLIGRLVDIQVVHAREYESLAARILTRPVRYLQAPRGRILDRAGRVLVSDEPAWDISVHYAVLTGRSETYLRAVALDLRKRGDYPSAMSLNDITARLHHDISDMWQRLAELTGRPVSEFIERGDRIRAGVENIQDDLRRRSGVSQPVREEQQLHPVIADASDEVALAVRLELEHLPWLRVVPGSRRVAHDADAVVHLLGRLGAVGPEHLEADPLRGDELRGLHPGDRVGTSGVEELAEPILRGTRGRIIEELDGGLIERLEPLPGSDVTLTIDMDLQRFVVGRLQEAVGKYVNPAGAAAVVLDVQTREVLALVSYPVYSREASAEEFEGLRRDAKRTPLRFRAVASQYPPGSTCKAITLVGALADNLTSPDERLHCTGHLLPDQPGLFRCWIYNQYHNTHDSEFPDGQRGEDAIRNSCNIYFFKMGGRLGPERLCYWFERFGLGHPPGSGLIEESPGIVPTESWLRRAQQRGYQTADAWNWSIGQGEVTATPLQVANVCATVAAGHWAPARLVQNLPARGGAGDAALEAPLPRTALQVLRTGMWRVVNEPGGTAYKHARLSRSDYVLCGKTGSAEAPPVPIAYRYTFEWPDGQRQSAVAYLEEDARQQLGAEQLPRVGKQTVTRYPELEAGERLPSHAWFMGYTQSAATPRGAEPTGHVYAIAVIIEFGGSGGQVAGPIVKDIAEWLLGRGEK